MQLVSKPPAGDQTAQRSAGDGSESIPSASVESSKKGLTSSQTRKSDTDGKEIPRFTEGEDRSNSPENPEHSAVPPHELRSRRIPLEAANAEDLIHEDDLKASLMENGIPEADIERILKSRRRSLDIEDSGSGVEDGSDQGVNFEELEKDFEDSLKESGATPEEIEVMKEGFFRAIAPRPTRHSPRRETSQE